MAQGYVYLVCLGAALLFTPGIVNRSSSNLTFKCDCINVTSATQDCTQSVGGSTVMWCNQTTYTCDCGTFFSNNESGCYYDCNNNASCYASELCDNLTSCYIDCHKNATCNYVNGSFVCICDSEFPEMNCTLAPCQDCHQNATCINDTCTCDEGFSGNGSYCEKLCEETPCNKTDFEYMCSCGNEINCTNQSGENVNCSLCFGQQDSCEYNTSVGNMTCNCNMTCAKPVHGNFSEWGNWSECYGNCGNGTQNRTRNCTNPAPAYNGTNCTGEFNQTQYCNLNKSCPIDGNFSIWSMWSNCSGCDGSLNGTRNRTRNCTKPEPQHGGQNCSGNYTEIEKCKCPMDGNFTLWGRWGSCINSSGVECGTNGTQKRNRSCSNPKPQNNGQNCTGKYQEERECVLHKCPVHGNFTEWSEWSNCSATCGTGEQNKTRNCTNPKPALGGRNCTGDYIEKQTCNLGACLGMENFTKWSNWSSCTVTCGGGVMIRQRNCTSFEGIGCDGPTKENKTCSANNCPVNGNYSEWTSWGSCSVTCGSGKTFRERTCTPAQFNGLPCKGEANQTEECSNPTPCPGEENFNQWSEWSRCSVTCLSGLQTRFRTCTVDDNVGCTGRNNETISCNEGECPVDGGYSNFSDWSSCPGTCGSAIQSRTRMCNNPKPSRNGSDCVGSSEEYQGCQHSTPCTGESGFTAWSNWTFCSKTCGDGVKIRTRRCNFTEPHDECSLNKTQDMLCNEEPCPVNGEWSNWKDWSRCSSSCGSGKRERKRTCSDPKPSFGGLSCYGSDVDYELCVMPDLCTGDEEFNPWGEWSSCNKTCGPGKQRRERTCAITPTYPPPEEKYCLAENVQNIDCYIKPCPVDGNFTQWTFWSPCSTSCGAGNQTRTRTCTAPAPMYEGQDCSGALHQVRDCETGSCPGEEKLTHWVPWVTCSAPCQGRTNRSRTCVLNYNCTEQLQLEMTKDCNTQLCNVNGSWSEWTSWSVCDLKCGHQLERRERYCNNPKPQAEGLPCSGHSKEEVQCSEYDYIPCEGQNMINGGWTDWTWWPACSKSCGNGVKKRYRTCTNPEAKYNGKNCTGESTVVELCNAHPCPVNGNFTEWTPWTNCSKICGSGNRTRERNCTNPEPKHGGTDCLGENNETEVCNTHFCPVHGNFTPWSKYSFCSKPCNTGMSTKTRSCTNPAPDHGGRNCSCENTVGIFSHPVCDDTVRQSRSCNNVTCPPVNMTIDIIFSGSDVLKYHGQDSDQFKSYVNDYVTSRYGGRKPAVGQNCQKLNESFECELIVFFNASDGDQFPTLQDIAMNPPNSSLISMTSEGVLNINISVTATVLSSTSIQLNWTISAEQQKQMNGISIFYMPDGDNSFLQSRIPEYTKGHLLISLKKYTHYTITICPTSVNGTGVPNEQLKRRTFEDTPSKAPKVNYSSPSPNYLIVSWDEVDTDYLHGELRGYCFFYKKTEERSFTNDTCDHRNYTLTNLKAYTKYYIQVAAKTTPGCGVKSEVLTAITMEDKPSEAPPAVTAVNSSSQSIFVQWESLRPEAQNGVILGYTVKYEGVNGKNGTIDVSAGNLKKNLTGLSIWTLYNISVSARTKIGNGPYSPIIEVSTDEGTPEHEPTILKAYNTSSTTIYLKWDKINISDGKLLGYRIRYQPLKTNRKKEVENLPTNTSECSLTGLFFWWPYQIEIGGFTRPGIGKISSKKVRTDEHLPSRAPETVTGIAETSTSMTVKWSDVLPDFVHGVLLGYKIEIKETNNLLNVIMSKTLDLVIPRPKEYSIYVQDLKKYTQYTIWIQAVNSKGAGTKSAPYIQRTGEDAPDAGPANIVASTLADISIIKLEWERIPENVAHGIIRGYYVEYVAVVLNGERVPVENRVNKTFRVRGNRYATILRNLIQGSTYEIRMYGVTILNGTKSPIVVAETCRCPEYIKANWWSLPPYTTSLDSGSDVGGLFPPILDMLLEMCGVCENGHGRSKFCYAPGCDQKRRRRREINSNKKNSLEDVLNNIKDTVDVSFPVQGNKYKTHDGHFAYISVVETPGSAFFTVKNIPSTSEVFINGAIVSLPLVSLIIVLSALAGIFIWGLERFKNPVSFPPSFIGGFVEGFWWAYISATTVGYGDRSPITIPGRLFAVIWIITGYCIITVLTGVMVNSVTLVIVTQQSSIYGSKVAALQNSTEYGKAIRQNAKVVPYSTVEEVLNAVKKKEVDGAILDMYVTATRKDFFEDTAIELNRLIEYPSGYGIVLSGNMGHCAPLINSYLNKMKASVLKIIEENTDVITQTRNVVKEAQEKSSGLFDAGSPSFRLVLFICLGLLGISLIAGMIWQLKYSLKLRKIVAERENSAGFDVYSGLKYEIKPSTEKHFRELMKKLGEVKERHREEIFMLSKIKKGTQGKNWMNNSAVRFRKMTSSVSPQLTAHENVALEVKDAGIHRELGPSTGDSVV